MHMQVHEPGGDQATVSISDQGFDWQTFSTADMSDVLTGPDDHSILNQSIRKDDCAVDNCVTVRCDHEGSGPVEGSCVGDGLVPLQEPVSADGTAEG